jgi:hypothetical protein
MTSPIGAVFITKYGPDPETTSQNHAEPLSAAAGLCARTNGQAGGLIRLSGRIPHGGDARSIILSPGQHPRPAHPGKAGCPRPSPGRHGLVISHRKASTANQ